MVTTMNKKPDLAAELSSLAKNNIPSETSLLEFSRYAMRRYGLVTVEDRSLPDYRDGLKPVQRRLLWAAHKLGLHSDAKRKKLAYLVGETLGKYHPHGDSSLASATVTMNNSAAPYISGEGNWGGGVANDSPAAMRYIECRLSALADAIYFDPEYTAVIEYLENYDGSLKEPLLLPAKLPAILLNGTSGVAVGITSEIPSYTEKSLRAAVKLTLKQGKQISPAQAVSVLEFNTPLGGECVSDDDSLLEFYKNSFGSVQYDSLFTYDEVSRIMLFDKFAPGLNLDSVLDFLNGRSARPPEWVKSIEDARETSSKSAPNTVSVRIKKSVPLKNIDDLINKIADKFATKAHYKINVIERYLNEEGANEAVPKSFSVPGLIKSWCDWRAELELKVIQHKINTINEKLHRLEVMILAGNNPEILKNGWGSKDLTAYLIKALKISAEDAEIIRKLRYEQLHRLDVHKMKAECAELKLALTNLESDKADPVSSILKSL